MSDSLHCCLLFQRFTYTAIRLNLLYYESYISIHAGLYVHRNREKENTLWYLECLVSVYLHNKIQPILFPFSHRLVWLLNPKPHPPLDDCQSEPQARGELSCAWSDPMQVVLSFFSSPALWFTCSSFFCLFSSPDFWFVLGFFCHHFTYDPFGWDVLYLHVYTAPNHTGLWSQIWVCVLLEYK